jgi:hypothetical protein
MLVFSLVVYNRKRGKDSKKKFPYLPLPVIIGETRGTNMEENENRTVVAKRDPDTKKKETARGLIYLAEFLLLGGIAVIVVKEMTKDSFTWYYGPSVLSSSVADRSCHLYPYGPGRRKDQ